MEHVGRRETRQKFQRCPQDKEHWAQQDAEPGQGVGRKKPEKLGGKWKPGATCGDTFPLSRWVGTVIDNKRPECQVSRKGRSLCIASHQPPAANHTAPSPPPEQTGRGGPRARDVQLVA